MCGMLVRCDMSVGLCQVQGRKEGVGQAPNYLNRVLVIRTDFLQIWPRHAGRWVEGGRRAERYRLQTP